MWPVRCRAESSPSPPLQAARGPPLGSVTLLRSYSASECPRGCPSAKGGGEVWRLTQLVARDSCTVTQRPERRLNCGCGPGWEWGAGGRWCGAGVRGRRQMRSARPIKHHAQPKEPQGSVYWPNWPIWNVLGWVPCAQVTSHWKCIS